MSVQHIAAVGPKPETGSHPQIAFVLNGERKMLSLAKVPFTIGRRPDRDLVIADARVSREHARIEHEGNDYILIDEGSKHGTWVNGMITRRHKLVPNDTVEFGAQGVAHIIFSPTQEKPASSAREFLTMIASPRSDSSAASGDLEKLSMYLEAARKLNTSGVLADILMTLLETTLRITGAERGFVFLAGRNGEMKMSAGRNSRGDLLTDDSTISHSILQESILSGADFLVSDTSKLSNLADRQSIVAYDLRTVICIPLRRTKTPSESAPPLRGILYLDSRFVAGNLSTVSHDILKAISTEAAALVENAYLVEAAEDARRVQQELEIASSIQQNLMAVRLPQLDFADLRARKLPCKEIGGDFYDVIVDEDGVTVIVTDVCGKGVSAALLASIMQGMVYSLLVAKAPLGSVVGAVNRFICSKDLAGKYATMVIARLKSNGDVEYVNCGHVPPVVVCDGVVTRLTDGDLPVGLLSDATYAAKKLTLPKGGRLILVTDGVTEAANCTDEMYGDERLEVAAASVNPYEEILTSVRTFCGETPLNDDCTIVEILYR